jgi:hypothetical protein
LNQICIPIKAALAGVAAIFVDEKETMIKEIASVCGQICLKADRNKGS